MTSSGVSSVSYESAMTGLAKLQQNLLKLRANAVAEYYETEFEINDLPQNVRWKVTHKSFLGPICECTGAAITTRGKFVLPGTALALGEKKLYLHIEGHTPESVKKAKSEIKRLLEELTQGAAFPSHAGKYSVL